MNSKQRKQADKLRAAALDGLESKQQAVTREIERLEKLRDEQSWYEQSRTAAADAERNERAIKRLEQHQTLEQEAQEIHTRSTELAKFFAELESRESDLERRKDMHLDNVSAAEAHLASREQDLDARAVLIDMANKPVKESINEILMLLELEETPEEIARLIRKKHHILEPKW